MPSSPVARSRLDYSRWISFGIFLAILIAAGASSVYWLPATRGWLASLSAAPKTEEHAGESAEEHAEHDHGHDHASAAASSIELSPQAQASIALKLGQVKLGDYERAITLPGMVVDRRGRSKVEITAPLTGIVTRIVPIEGEAVAPGQVLFEMRLTHEELVQAQANLLRTAEELDVIRREIARLEVVAQGGGIAGKTVLERKYEEQKEEASLRAEQQALMLHGLSQQQVDDILKTRVLLGSLAVKVPTAEALEMDPAAGVLQVQELRVERGQHVMAGDTLAVLTDHAQLLIEGEAFEQDGPQITRAIEDRRPITAIIESKGREPVLVHDLKIQYQASRYDPASRALHFYVVLPNRLTRDTGVGAEHRFVDWLYKPGQRMQLRIPVEVWRERIVLPADAVAQEGVEAYVFRANGKRFDRQGVRVEERDPSFVLIANDGSLFPGETIALSAAQQLQLALKNKAGGGIDPHAGHNH